MENFKSKVLSGVLWSTLERFSSQIIGFVVSMILARLLMPEEYGIVAMTGIFMVITATLVDAGFGAALIQKESPDDTDYCTVLYTSSFVGLILYGLLFVIAPFAADFFRTPSFTWVLRIYSISLLWAGYRSVLNAYLYKRLLYKQFFFRTLVVSILSAVIGISMAYMGYGVWALVTQSIVCDVVSIVILQLYVPWKPSLKYSFARSQELLAFGGNLAFASLIGATFNELKGFLIGRLYTPADLGFFNKGDSLPRLVFSNINSFSNNVLFPALSQYSNDRERVKSLARRFMKVSVFVMYFAMSLLLVSAEPIIRLLYTEKWVPCVPYMQLICIQLMIEMVSFINLQTIKAVGEGKVILKLEIYKKPVFLFLTLVGAYISVYALAITLPLYGLYGTIVNMLPNRKILKYSMKEQIFDILPPTLLSLLAFAFSLLINKIDIPDIPMIICQSLMVVTCFFGLSYIFKIDNYILIKDLFIDYVRQKK